MTFDPVPQLITELSLPQTQIKAVLALLAEGNTIPFIARYRKEVTGSLDEVQVRTIKERSEYLIEFNERRNTILKSIESQGKLTDELKNKIMECTDKNALEDLYLPYKPKRRTKATIAKELGLEPLAVFIKEQNLDSSPEIEAAKFVNEQVKDIAAALEGARHIMAEWISEDAEVRAHVREVFLKQGMLISKAKEEFLEKETKFKQYYNHSEAIHKIPSHRYLAIRRGEQEGVLSTEMHIESEPILEWIESQCKLNKRSKFANELSLAVKDSFKRLIAPTVETDVRVDLKIRADNGALEIFAQNLENLLLSAPLGGKQVIGIDPGFRTGCKCAAVSQTGQYLDSITIFIATGAGGVAASKKQFVQFVKRFNPIAIAIGNGTASRETEQFVRETLKEEDIKDIIIIQVSECGASVYSASDVAREEFPELDLTIRGAISIARRLQDPLAELVKVEPKALGVGQYQHDVYQPLLEQKLHDAVESCVNRVGVDLNTASASLLSYVAGIGSSLSKKIISHRDKKGPFKTRQELMEVAGLGPKAFEQAAGFLRIRGGTNPLDNTAVHPERYGIVTKIVSDLKLSLDELPGRTSALENINLATYKCEGAGEETLKDIISELKKPGRDPRKSFEMPKFREDVTKIEELKKGMVLEGIITNVTAFGAFVDIGVHQDGLIHISQLSDKRIDDPSKVVKTGDRIKVEVLEINIELKRISLSARIGASSAPPRPAKQAAPMAPKKPKFDQSPFAHL